MIELPPSPGTPTPRLERLDALEGRVGALESGVASIAQGVNALLQRPAAPEKPPMSSATADMLAVMNAASQTRQSALDEIGKTLQIVQGIQAGKVNLAPEEGSKWIKDLVETAAPYIVPILAKAVSGPVTPAPPATTPAPTPVTPKEPPRPPQEVKKA